MSISQEQLNLIDAMDSIQTMFKLIGKSQNDATVVHHQYAFDNSPGFNILLDNMRFELTSNDSRVRFSIPHEEDSFEAFKEFILIDLGFKDVKCQERSGIKYIFEIDLNEQLKSEEGIHSIVELAGKVFHLNKP